VKIFTIRDVALEFKEEEALLNATYVCEEMTPDEISGKDVGQLIEDGILAFEAENKEEADKKAELIVHESVSKMLEELSRDPDKMLEDLKKFEANKENK